MEYIHAAAFVPIGKMLMDGLEIDVANIRRKAVKTPYLSGINYLGSCGIQWLLTSVFSMDARTSVS